MGSFDEVILSCPECGKETIAQSKGGDCTLETFYFENAPASVLGYLVDDGTYQCAKCGTTFKVESKYEIVKVAEPPVERGA
jgi:transposase-like protein